MRTTNPPEIDLDEINRGTRRAINNIRSRIADLRWVVDQEERILSEPDSANGDTRRHKPAQSYDPLHQES